MALAVDIAEAIRRIARWAAERDDIAGVLLVGSRARGTARPESDIDVVVLSRDTNRYRDGAWVDELAIAELTGTRPWGAITEYRLVAAGGFEVEINIGHPDWARTDPIDPGTRRVVTEGARIVHDPGGVLAALLHACGRLPGPRS
ncbi:hypothetical protein FHU38_005087 [Saccharomonospora amisosensis]|uniref:Polymerase nucleotidyl transferase domain-containing protein n=1 Tax=Saccharomonospora amisosensis TaxID=1128677 RepID=A0A7X5UUW8_9PSEU|nr:nucleotidyltransferase domain-containing protein [Saccharomonospora amisosensis]NIJ14686.1 hypothetical protein [Saccharomonospora amisosensis]